MKLGMALMMKRGGHNKASAMQPKSMANMKRTLVKRRPAMSKRGK